jgi:hypothetical protein
MPHSLGMGPMIPGSRGENPRVDEIEIVRLTAEVERLRCRLTHVRPKQFRTCPKCTEGP